ncbi:5-formyltetrahydrofolate cyclo-ligase [Rouxiella sp. Mn2063]|uniref:5-formyltetrahydrofolate cyclo-ligase n=1 Tax=Rouxiella sp. Mn2063 TaxID=3395262 RepID=UPI003BBAF967
MSFTAQYASLRQSIRSEVRQRRKQLSTEQQQQFAMQIVEQVTQHEKIQQATTLSVFLSFDGELDTTPLIRHLWQQGKQLCLPVLHPFSSGNLLFLRYAPDTPLIRNRFNILEPALDITQMILLSEVDIVFTPLVAFDSHGQRLGMGGGFYDRTLQHWQENGPYPIGLAHDCQQVAQLPVEEWDIPLPEIITPEKVWRW